MMSEISRTNMVLRAVFMNVVFLRRAGKPFLLLPNAFVSHFLFHSLFYICSPSVCVTVVCLFVPFPPSCLKQTHCSHFNMRKFTWNAPHLLMQVSGCSIYSRPWTSSSSFPHLWVHKTTMFTSAPYQPLQMYFQYRTGFYSLSVSMLLPWRLE